MYTSEARIDTKEVEEFFFPTLFQEMIDKDVEIRTFVIEKKIYSMAIFSQLDRQTQVDFRRYNHNKMNRMVPFKLPTNLEVKIINFMQSINLNTGSIDFIKGKDGNYYFLEINPTGQYGFLSAMCNYNLDEVIARQLISPTKTFTNG
jgi:glutathione synthase/RimK-type ligase-like ATP-grasp enzyme